MEITNAAFLQWLQPVVTSCVSEQIPDFTFPARPSSYIYFHWDPFGELPDVEYSVLDIPTGPKIWLQNMFAKDLLGLELKVLAFALCYREAESSGAHAHTHNMHAHMHARMHAHTHVRSEECSENLPKKLFLKRGIQSASYKARLCVLEWTSLEDRRNCTDLVLMFRILKGHTEGADELFRLHAPYIGLRGNKMRITCDRPRLDIRKYFYCSHIVDKWNALDIDITIFKNAKQFADYLYERTGC